MKLVLTLAMMSLLMSCSSHPVLPTVDDIKVTRDEPKSDCKHLGPIEGRVTSIKGAPEQALEDLKKEAVKKGANFVKIESQGANGTAIRGASYFCN